MTFLRKTSKLFFIPLFATSLLVMSCQETKETNKEATDVVPEATLEQKKQQLESVSPTQSSSATTAEPGALNPPHGQPGHRCDIAVGAPLDGSRPAQNSPLKVSPLQNQSSTPAAKPADGLNPPHGQPGHRCDIKVGDPL